MIIGAGDRAYNFCKDLNADILGIYDPNAKRAMALGKMLNVEAKINEHVDQPDLALIFSPDYTHVENIEKWGPICDVLCEKPLFIKRENLPVIKKFSDKIYTIQNYKNIDYFRVMKESLPEIGQIIAVDYNWFLDRSHGADYFRRWHKIMGKSGGLLLTKAVHHFYLLNWWLGRTPQYVMATGAKVFYGNEQQRRTRCKDCDLWQKCDFYIDLSKNEIFKTLYLDCEQDGYMRDSCVWSDADIYDFMRLHINYNGDSKSKDISVNYTLSAFHQYEGMKAIFHGLNGSMECDMRHSYVGGQPAFDDIKIYTGGNQKTISVSKRKGQHWGADTDIKKILEKDYKILRDIYPTEDAIQACLLGIAANESINRVKITKL